MSKNIAVIYVSRHHGNTEKLVRGRAAGTGIRIIPLEKALEEDFSGYDAVGLASGIYGFSFDPELAAFALQTDKLPSGHVEGDPVDLTNAVAVFNAGVDELNERNVDA